MSTKRFFVLTLGPVVLVTACYWVTFEFPHRSPDTLAAAEVIELPPPRDAALAGDDPELQEACNIAAAQLIRRLGESYRIAVESPFVIAGDMPEATLRRHYEQTIEPIVYALNRSYFSTPPDQPISIVMLTTAQKYRAAAEALDRYDAVRYHGYYRRDDRRIVLDLSSGNGTLAHELTHALLGFDFPNAPEWFDEGLASLHEQGAFNDAGDTLLGHHNWRLLSLRQAARTGQLKPIEEVIESPGFREEGEGLHYAQVRYLCLFLQHRGLLKPYYRRFRQNAAFDPTGIATLRELLNAQTSEQIDHDFRLWLADEFHKVAKSNR